MSVADYKLQIPPEIGKFVDKAAPREAKLLAAKAMVPMAPNILVTVLFMLTLDADEEVRNTASQSLSNQPESQLNNLLNQPIHPKILDFYARQKTDKQELIEKILINRLTPDDTFVYLAPMVNERLLTIIAENQERLLRCTPIAEALRKNPHAPQSLVDRVISFLRMNGIILKGVAAELSKEKVEELMKSPDDDLLTTIFDESVDESLDDLAATLFDESDEEKPAEVVETDRQMLRKLSTLNIAQKVKLALKGNKEVRTTLIKDPNKLVATAVIKSPKMQESEVISIASMRSVNDEVLRLIAVNPEWTRNYNLKYALVSNPKCPIPISMAFLKHLRVNELGLLSKNKNVSQQIQKAAKNLHAQKR